MKEVMYCDYNSVLVINPQGKLRRVYVPFRVRAKNAAGESSQHFIVDEVRTTEKDELVYVIANKNYYHHQFVIEIKF